MTNTKSSTCFRMVPKSTTLDDPEGPLRTLFLFWYPTTKIWMKIDLHRQQRRARWLELPGNRPYKFYADIRGVPCGQEGWRQCVWWDRFDSVIDKLLIVLLKWRNWCFFLRFSGNPMRFAFRKHSAKVRKFNNFVMVKGNEMPLSIFMCHEWVISHLWNFTSEFRAIAKNDKKNFSGYFLTHTRWCSG